MKKKLTSEIARCMIAKIEGLQEQIREVFTDARENYEGRNNDSVLHDALRARNTARDAADEAEGYIGSFDIEDEDA